MPPAEALAFADTACLLADLLDDLGEALGGSVRWAGRHLE
jgi:hypothetical protein